MVLPQYNKNNHLVAYDKIATGDFAPRLIPLLQFRPTHISNEPALANAVPSASVRGK